MSHRTTRLARPTGMLRPVLAAALLAVLAGCTPPQPGAEMEQQQACGQQADRQFEKQNRYLMSEQDQTGTPFSSRGMPGDTTQGLSDQYRRDRMVDDCMHSTPGTEPTVLPSVPATR